MPRDPRKDALMPRIRLPLILITLVGCAAGRQPTPPQISVALPLAAPALGASEVATEPDAQECPLPDKTATAPTQAGSMDVRTVAFEESQQANSAEPAPSARPLPLTSLPESTALDSRHEYPLNL